MQLISKVKQNRGEINLLNETSTTLTIVGDLYPLNGVFTDGTNRNFTTNSDGTIIVGKTGWYKVNGVSDYKANKVSQVTFVLCINEAPGPDTPHTFDNANSYANISVTDITYLTKGDVLQIKAKSTVASTIITVYKMTINFLESL